MVCTCQIKPNELIIWDVNKDQNCKFISIGVFDGIINKDETYWINNDNQIALNLLDKHKRHCGNYLQYTSEGYALKSTIREKRSTNLLASTFQEAGELQYLETNFENHLSLLAKIFCQMHHDHNNILETLLIENPRKYIEKVLNYSAINAKIIETDIGAVIEVTFCKKIKDNLIDSVDLNLIGNSKLKEYMPVNA